MRIAIVSISFVFSFTTSYTQHTVKVAIIDDGFLLSHTSIENFIYVNPAENPFNQIDDDNNGYINDIRGWDISDRDNDVQPNDAIIADYFHGTFIASAICGIATQYLGEEASKLIQIIPIKAASDTGDPNRLLDGYSGIQYAQAIGADIIITAWNGGNITGGQYKIIQDAQFKGALIIAAAGNEATDRPTPPASIDGVLSVSAIDQTGQKMFFSNYGKHIDISAIGEGVTVATSSCDTCYSEGTNTSLSVALIGGVVAVIKALNPNLTNENIVSIVKNSADPFSNLPHEYVGKLGSGMVNMNRAIKLSSSVDYLEYHDPLLTEGVLFHDKNQVKTRSSWTIEPEGGIHQTTFNIDHLEPYDQEVNLYVKKNGKIIEKWITSDFLSDMSIEGTGVELIITSSSHVSDIRVSYESIVLDSSNYYCHKENVVSEQVVGVISDGSGSHDYTNGTDCKWILNASQGSSLYLEFIEFDTEANVDHVYIFEGTKPLKTKLIAKLSGNQLPPKIHTHSNEVLVWFVSDDQVNGKGWKMEYVAIEE